jgi:hypothetical protein
MRGAKISASVLPNENIETRRIYQGQQNRPAGKASEAVGGISHSPGGFGGWQFEVLVDMNPVPGWFVEASCWCATQREICMARRPKAEARCARTGAEPCMSLPFQHSDEMTEEIATKRR